MTILFRTPVLHEDSSDYKNPKAYKVDVKIIEDNKLEVSHTLEHGNLVKHLVSASDADFFATVNIKEALFRQTFWADFAKNRKDQSDRASIRHPQEVTIPKINPNWKLIIEPGVCLKSRGQKIKWDDSTGIENITGIDDYVYDFPQYCLLACSDPFTVYPYGPFAEGLFEIKFDPEMKKGEFTAIPKILPESGGLRVRIELHPILAEYFGGGNESPQNAHVICTAFAQVLQKLKDLYAQGSEAEDYDLLEAAEGLKWFLKNEGLPTWEDHEKFNPSLIASRLKKVSTPKELEA